MRAPSSPSSLLSKRAPKRPRGARGFTLIEVMMALTILTIGILGIISMQKSAVVTNNDAQQFTVATQLARTWLDRLNRDSTVWNHPSVQQAASDIADTLWLKAVNDGSLNYPKWFVPAAVDWTGFSESPAFDRNGADIAASASAALLNDTVYCTHVRLRWIYPDQLIRAEVRVFWRKKSLGAGSTYGTNVGFTSNMCPATGTSSVANAVMGQDTANFRWVYAVTSIARQGPK